MIDFSTKFLLNESEKVYDYELKNLNVLLSKGSRWMHINRGKALVNK